MHLIFVKLKDGERQVVSDNDDIISKMPNPILREQLKVCTSLILVIGYLIQGLQNYSPGYNNVFYLKKGIYIICFIVETEMITVMYSDLF